MGSPDCRTNSRLNSRPVIPCLASFSPSRCRAIIPNSSTATSISDANCAFRNGLVRCAAWMARLCAICSARTPDTLSSCTLRSTTVVPAKLAGAVSSRARGLISMSCRHAGSTPSAADTSCQGTYNLSYTGRRTNERTTMARGSSRHRAQYDDVTSRFRPGSGHVGSCAHFPPMR